MQCLGYFWILYFHHWGQVAQGRLNDWCLMYSRFISASLDSCHVFEANNSCSRCIACNKIFFSCFELLLYLHLGRNNLYPSLRMIQPLRALVIEACDKWMITLPSGSDLIFCKNPFCEAIKCIVPVLPSSSYLNQLTHLSSMLAFHTHRYSTRSIWCNSWCEQCGSSKAVVVTGLKL